MAKTGRPRIELKWDDFEKLCSLHCTRIEIAEFFDCSEDTIERHVKRHYKETFAVVFKKKSSKGKISLRRQQYEAAQKGNITMLIWLGKQYLGQTDKVEQKQNVNMNHKEVVEIQWADERVADDSQNASSNASTKTNQPEH